MIPKSASRNFGYGIRDPGNRARFPGCCTLQSIATILRRNVMELGFSSNLIRIFAHLLSGTLEMYAIRLAEGFLDRNPAG